MYEDPKKAGPLPKQTLALLKRLLPGGPGVPPQQIKRVLAAATPQREE